MGHSRTNYWLSCLDYILSLSASILWQANWAMHNVFSTKAPSPPKSPPPPSGLHCRQMLTPHWGLRRAFRGQEIRLCNFFAQTTLRNRLFLTVLNSQKITFHCSWCLYLITFLQHKWFDTPAFGTGWHPYKMQRNSSQFKVANIDNTGSWQKERRGGVRQNRQLCGRLTFQIQIEVGKTFDMPKMEHIPVHKHLQHMTKRRTGGCETKQAIMLSRAAKQSNASSCAPVVPPCQNIIDFVWEQIDDNFLDILKVFLFSLQCILFKFIIDMVPLRKVFAGK